MTDDQEPLPDLPSLASEHVAHVAHGAVVQWRLLSGQGKEDEFYRLPVAVRDRLVRDAQFISRFPSVKPREFHAARRVHAEEAEETVLPPAFEDLSGAELRCTLIFLEVCRACTQTVDFMLKRDSRPAPSKKGRTGRYFL